MTIRTLLSRKNKNSENRLRLHPQPIFEYGKEKQEKGLGVEMKPSGIGGMATIEGVMMRNKDEYAIAVRKPNNEIIVEKKEYKSFSDKVKLFKLPLLRGILSFIESLVIGMKVINFSASFFEDEEEVSEKTSDSGNIWMMIAAVVLALAITIVLFMVLPVVISNFIAGWIDNRFWLNLIEGIIRIGIFIGYVLLASRMEEIQRVFQYHGAEHKAINCIEHGFELNLENVRWQSKEHKRCGTSFVFYVVIISLIVFIILPPMDIGPRIISRIVLLPLISGISYEFIRLAGRTENKIVNLLSKPGLLMQKLTTKEPEDDMIEVAIEAVEAVFDWQAFIEAAPADETDSLISETDTKGKEEEDNIEEEEEDDILKALDKYL